MRNSADLDKHRVKRILARIKVPLEVLVEKFKDQIEATVVLHHVTKTAQRAMAAVRVMRSREPTDRRDNALDNVRVLKLLEERDLAERSARHPFVLQLEADFLSTDGPAGLVSCVCGVGDSQMDGDQALTFIATKSPVTRSLPLYTTPYAPSPCDWPFSTFV